MILTQEKVNHVETYGVNSSRFELDTDGMSHIMDILSTNIYKNSLTFIQEMLANAWDATLEAGKKSAIFLEVNQDVNGKWFVKISDNGIGISPERIDKVFKVIGKSTKRSSSSQIGGYGIGRISAFAYTNQVMVETRYNGVLYNYLWYLGEENIPEITLLSSNKTDQINGSSFTIYLKNSPEKYGTTEYGIVDFIKEQTIYFDNLIYVGNYISDLNNVRIYHYKDFAICESNHYSEIHLLVGQVKYAISWKDLGISRIELPLALKFGIEDGITPLASRDTVRYTKKAKEKILAKIEKVKDFLAKKYNKTVEDCKDIQTWLNAVNRTAYLELNGKSLNLSKLNITSLKSPYYKPLDGLYIHNIKTYKNILPFKFSHKLNGRTEKLGHGNNNWREKDRWRQYLEKGIQAKVYSIEGRIKPSTNNYLNSLGEDIYLLRKEKRDNEKLLNVFHNPDKDKKIAQYEAFVESEWNKYPKYEDIVIPKTFKVKKKKSGILKPTDTITLYVGRKHVHDSRTSVFKKGYYKLSELKNKKIIYSLDKKDNLEKIMRPFNNIWVVKVTKTVYKQLENQPNMIKEEELGYNRHFCKVVTAGVIKKMLKDNYVIVQNKNLIKSLHSETSSLITHCEEYCNKYYESSTDLLHKDMVNIATIHNWWDFNIYHDFLKLQKLLKHFEFFKYLKGTDGYRSKIKDDCKDFIIQTLKCRKQLRLNIEHYGKDS